MTSEDYLLKEDTAWLAAFVTELLVILLINSLTLVAFARIRHLRRINTYLIINLTMADFLVGALTVPCKVVYENEKALTWTQFIQLTTIIIFPLASQVNLCLISLERLHATLFPFRHCLIGKWSYYRIIATSWLITLGVACLMAYLHLTYCDAALSYIWASFSLLTLLVLAVSYIIIIRNVRGSPHSQSVAIGTERKLTVTLFIATGVSVLTILPSAFFSSLPPDIQKKIYNTSSIHIEHALAVVYFASSIVNPLVYTTRLQEFRKAIRKLVTRQ